MSKLRAPRIVIDEREKNSDIPELLRSAGAAIEFAQLKVGDYIVSAETAVERKTVTDLLSSVYDGRLFIQCSELVQHFPRPIVLIQGNLAELAEAPSLSDMEGNNGPHARNRQPDDRIPIACDSLAEVVLNYRIPVLHAATSDQAAQILVSLVNQSLNGGRGSGPLLRKIKKENPLRTQQLSILASIPGIGEKLADRMLNRFGTPGKAINASTAELAVIPGFGLARAQRARRILDTQDITGQEIERRRGYRQNKLFANDT